ncbi:HNH endonuclease [Bradyrhizobium sp. CSS354]|uniref:HNH endonuclease n=1 Tax=Bradyrhizobium sp. CSS354 TaxID=2699172 RepID=UPI0023AE9F2B|nr:HNH endonuclease [Bradyrhizobium sp. CSS354]MDE5464374.1 hypothetical protein [Bradyrhizobium sp. CSS354]
MASTLKRQLNEEEKSIILARFGRRCYANGHAISEEEQVQFDHIHAHVRGGDSELNNIAPMCSQHNKQKGQLSLEDFRTKLQLDAFFEIGAKLTLRHLLAFLQQNKRIDRYGLPIVALADDGAVKLDTQSGDLSYTLYKCPTTGWQYFYATLDISLLDSDDEGDDSIGLQPRYLIKDKVFSLYRHFQAHPVLQPSIGRITGSHIRLFDGQHKIAALLMNGRRVFECKIYLNPNLRLLNDTNIAAHDAFAQTRFYSSIMVMKLGAEFAQDFEDFKNLEQPQIKNEQAFFHYVLSRPNAMLTKAELNRRFRAHLYNSVLTDQRNKLDRFVSRGNRGTDEQPITMDMLDKSIFAHFLYREPAVESMTAEEYRRDDELSNMVDLCSMLVDGGLESWDAKAPKDDQHRLRLQRIFSSKSMMAWSELLWDAVCARLEITDTDERLRVFYRQLSTAEIERVRRVVLRLYDWSHWSTPKDDQIDRILSDKKTAVKDWFKAHGLTTGYLMGASA